jgi:hypothetical protein
LNKILGDEVKSFLMGGDWWGGGGTFVITHEVSESSENLKEQSLLIMARYVYIESAVLRYWFNSHC